MSEEKAEYNTVQKEEAPKEPVVMPAEKKSPVTLITIIVLVISMLFLAW